MKSSKVEVKVNRLGNYSVLGLMILALSGGSVLGAAEFKLWHLKKSDGKPGAALQHLDQAGQSKAIEMLSGTDAKRFTEFVKKWQKEPFKMIEGIKASFIEMKKDAKADKKAIEKIQKDLIAGFEAVETKEFDGVESRKEMFMSIINQMFDENFDMDSETFLRDLFDLPEELSALRITNQKPAVKPEPTTSPEPTTPPTTGEVEPTDAELKAKADQICSEINGKAAVPGVDPRIAQFENDIKALQAKVAAEAAKAEEAKRLANEAANKLAEQRPEVKKDDKDATDAIAELAKILGQDQNQEEQVQAPQSQQQPVAAQRRDDNSAEDFKNPTPQATPEQPQTGPIIPPTASTGAVYPVKVEAPTNQGSAEINSSNAALANKGASIMSRVIPGNIPYLQLLRDEAMQKRSSLQMELTKAQSRIEKLEKDKKNIGINAATKEQRDRLQGEAEKMKKSAEDARAAFNSLAAEQKTPEAQQAVQQAQSAATAKETEWQNYEKAIKRAEDSDVKNAKEEVESSIDKLNANVGELKKEIEVASKAEEQLNGMIAQGQGGQQNARPNAFNRITTGNGGTRAGVTTRPSTLGGALNGGTQRGPLAGKN